MNEFQVDGMILVGTGYAEDEHGFRLIYAGHDYDGGLTGLEAPASFLDVGASLGGFTLGMMKRFPGSRIIAVEANPYVYGCLCRNVSQGVDPMRVTLLNRAIDSNARSGMDVVLTTTDDATTGGTILPRCKLDWEQHPGWGAKPRKVVATVRTIGVSEILDTYRIMPTVLKLDCEGSETEILEDLRDGNRLCWIDRIVGEWHGIGRLQLVKEILRKTHEVDILRIPGMPIGLFHARRRW